MNRRLVLGLGAAAVAASALPAGLLLRPGADGPVPGNLVALSPEAFRVLRAVAARVAPGAGPAFPTAERIGLASRVEAHLRTMDPSDAAELETALLLLENALGGFVLTGRTAPFTLSSPAEQDRALDAWRRSALPDLRKAFKALRALCATAYYADPRVREAVGYDGPRDFGQREAPAIQPAQAEVPA